MYINMKAIYIIIMSRICLCGQLLNDHLLL